MLGIEVDALRGQGEGWSAVGPSGGRGWSFALGLLGVCFGLGIGLGQEADRSLLGVMCASTAGHMIVNEEEEYK
jgi:hypothetical protein